MIGRTQSAKRAVWGLAGRFPHLAELAPQALSVPMRVHYPPPLLNGGDQGEEVEMAARKKKKGKRKAVDLIISKSRTKGAVKKCNVGAEFYGALDGAVRAMIKDAEARAIGNKRKTLKAVDL